MKRKLLVLIVAVLVLSGVAVAVVPWTGFGAPRVAHSVEQRANCTSCHGLSGPRPYPTWHAQRQLANTDCLRCHKPALAASTKGGS